jgi:hypothetical protein
MPAKDNPDTSRDANGESESDPLVAMNIMTTMMGTASGKDATCGYFIRKLAIAFARSPRFSSAT